VIGRYKAELAGRTDPEVVKMLKNKYSVHRNDIKEKHEEDREREV